MRSALAYLSDYFQGVKNDRSLVSNGSESADSSIPTNLKDLSIILVNNSTGKRASFNAPDLMKLHNVVKDARLPVESGQHQQVLKTEALAEAPNDDASLRISKISTSIDSETAVAKFHPSNPSDSWVVIHKKITF